METNNQILNILYSEDYKSDREKIKNWEKLTPLGKVLWFKFCDKGPDGEFSDTALKAHCTLPFYEEEKWEITKHSGGKIIKPKDIEKFSADLMTGWWIPFTKIFKLNKGKVENGIMQKGFDSWFNDFKEANSEILNNSKFMKRFNGFLDVVYTVGNTIPAPTSWKPGRGLDNFDYKLDCIRKAFDQNIEYGQTAIWAKYINKYYIDAKGTWENFIVSNYLKMYFDEDDTNFQKPKRFWENRPINSGASATLDDWTTYFKNVTACINKRNEEIQKALNTKKMKGDE